MATTRRPDDPRSTAVLLRRHLVAQGWTDQMLARGLRDGSLARPRRGAYVDGAAWRELDALGRHELTARAACAASDLAVVVSHSSAVPLHGGTDYGLDLSTVHLTRPDGRAGRAEAGVRQHRGRLGPDDVVTRHGVEVTSATRTGLELTTMLDLEAAVVHLNDLTHRRETTPQRLASRYRDGMEQWPNSLASDLALRLCEPRCESVAESRFWVLCWRQGLPAPEPQFAVYDERGRLVAFLDFAWPEHGLFVEVDGVAKYLKLRREGESVTDVVLREKKREDLARRLTDWRCRRVIWADLDRPAATAAMVREALFPSRALV